MITILCAYHKEAQGILAHYQCKPFQISNPIPSPHTASGSSGAIHASVFRNEPETIQVIIVGQGLEAAFSLMQILTLSPPSQMDHFINLGVAAGSHIGHLYRCHKITDIASLKTYFPDILCRSPIDETELYTSPIIIDNLQDFMASHNISNPLAIFDMEAAYLYSAAQHFFTQERMHFLKIVSDFGAEQFQPAKVTTLLQSHLSAITTYIDILLALPTTVSPLSAEDHKLLLQICHDLHASKTMEFQIQQIFTYAKLSAFPLQEEIEMLYKQNQLPCISKKEGLKILHELRKKLL